MKAFIAPELTPIEDLVEGVYAMSGTNAYNRDWGVSKEGISNDTGSHTDLHLILRHGGNDYESPAGRRIQTEWTTDFKINTLETDADTCTYEITNGGYGFKLTTTRGYNNCGETVDMRLRITGETEYGSSSIGKSSLGALPESDHHITSGLTLIGWTYIN